jgi:hypothetical protein
MKKYLFRPEKEWNMNKRDADVRDELPLNQVRKQEDGHCNPCGIAPQSFCRES